MSYLSPSDITDAVVKQHTLTAYLTEADAELLDMAESLGVMSSTSIVAPLHNTVKQFLTAYVCMRVCEDNVGVNNLPIPAEDKYEVKRSIYEKKYQALRSRISSPMLTGTVDEARDRAGAKSGIIFRG
jgi:hypothetical protein